VTWAPEGKRKLDSLKSTGEEQLKQKETAWDGHHGIHKQFKSQKTGRSGDAALKPYAPTGTKKNGEVKVKKLWPYLDPFSRY